MLAAAVLSGGLLAGCGLHDPGAAYYSATTPAVSKAAVNPTPAPERGGTIPQSAKAQLAANAASASPAAALKRYANLACDWTAANVAARQRQLVNDSLGQARANAQQALAELAADRTLAANSIVNRCQIVSLAAGAGPAKRQWVVVLEQSTAGGRGLHQPARNAARRLRRDDPPTRRIRGDPVVGTGLTVAALAHRFDCGTCRRPRSRLGHGGRSPASWSRCGLADSRRPRYCA